MVLAPGFPVYKEEPFLITERARPAYCSDLTPLDRFMICAGKQTYMVCDVIVVLICNHNKVWEVTVINGMTYKGNPALFF